MSNLLKNSHVHEANKRLLQAKPVQQGSISKFQPEEQLDELTLQIQQLEAQKQRLIAELEEIEQQSRAIQEQINLERQEVEQTLHKQRQTLLDELALQRETTIKEAEQSGFDQGYEAGYRQIKEEMAEQVQQLTKVVELAYQERDQIIQSAEPFLLDLSTQIAQKVLTQALAEDRALIIPIIQSVLQQISDMKEIKIEIDPSLYELLLNNQEELKHWLDKDCRLQIVPKQLDIEGNCVIHTPKGSYDLSVSQQLEEIKEQLLAFYKENGESC